MNFPRVLALFQEEVMSEAQVVEWADRQITAAPAGGALPDWLMMLSIRGVRDCLEDPDCELPRAEELSLRKRFALQATNVDFANDRSVRAFAAWAFRTVFGQEFECPEVSFGYKLQDWWDGDPAGALQFTRSELEKRRAEDEAIRRELVEGDEESGKAHR